MSISSNAYVPGGAHFPGGGKPLRCRACRNDTHLVIRVIESHQGPADALVDVSYTCTACGRHHAHVADVTDVAFILNRPGNVSDVLVFGGHYIHCGRPMERAGHELRRLHAPVGTSRPDGEALDVYLSTRVIRCACGFQMELPE
jgi:DNA-directed RNA polymerase subunit RPC12/RpoP